MWLIRLKLDKHLRKFSTQITVEQFLTEANRNNFENRFKKSCSLLQLQKVTDKYSAVLIPICTNDEGDSCLLYTKRSAHLRTHVKQISFPGGVRDHTDTSFEECALRETEEEIGLPKEKVKIWASGDLIKPPHTAAIMPIVGIIGKLDQNDLKLNKFEVEEVFIVPIKDLCNSNNLRHTQFRGGYSSPVFILQDKHIKIWGVTGMITQFFLSSLLPKEMFKSKLKYIVPYNKIKR